MTLYFDTKVELLDSDAVSTISRYHSIEPIFAVASYNHARGGSVTIFTDSGEPIHDVTYPIHPTSQATAIVWHPEKILLATGWENGDIHVWLSGHREFATVNGPHKSPITLIEFSELGGRMVTVDSMGLLTGWRCDGQYQFLTMFSHDVRDTLLHITFRITVESEVRDEMASLAKLAVAGDENALDTLTNWRPRTAARNLSHAGVKDNHCFYVGTQTGIVYYINQGGTCTEVLKTNTIPIIQMLWHPKKDAVVCLMEDMTVTLYLVESTGILTELDRVKLSGKAIGTRGSICWAGNSLAILTGNMSVRIWEIEKSDNYLLQLNMPNSLHSPHVGDSPETISCDSSSLTSHGRTQSSKQAVQSSNTEALTCLAYSSSNHTLCAGTNLGNVYTWKRVISYYITMPEDTWQLTNISSVRGSIKQCSWGFNEVLKPCILVNCISNVYVLKEQPLLSYHSRDVWAAQRNAKSIYLEHSCGRQCLLKAEFTITQLTLDSQNLVISNGRRISTYSIEKIEEDDDENTNFLPILKDMNNAITTSDATRKMTTKPMVIRLMQTFPAECLSLFIHKQNIFSLTSNEVMIYSIGGVVLNKIQPNDNEGKIIGMDLTGAYLSIFTMNGFIKAYDMTRHDPKLLFPSKSGYDLFHDFGEIIKVKCNSDGTHLAISIANRNFVPESALYCWDFEKNILMKHELPTVDLKKASLPFNFYWDSYEPRLLAMEIKTLQERCGGKPNIKEDSVSNDSAMEDIFSGEGKSRKLANKYVETQVLIMFYAEKKSELNTLEKSILNCGEQLINLCVPHVVILDINVVRKSPLEDFIDLPDCDAHTRTQVLNFSLYVAEGNMDMAYRCIRSIQSNTIWTNLAKMCVQTGRLDVAKVALGHLEKARAARALRQANENDYDHDTKVAVLATELGMFNKAKHLYKKSGRYDLLIKLFRACGEIDEAIRIAETKDRVHLKNTYYQKAVELNKMGDVKGSLEYFERTQNPVQNITQILLENPADLKRYMQNTTDKKMLKWWGQYVESSGDMKGALAVYQKAEDWFSQVKIYCYLGKISKADAMARQSGDRAACYHLARYYENIGKFQEAIKFYTRAQTFSNAIRICKENNYQDELWTVASSSRNRDKAIAAAYFEDCRSYKRAVELYHRAGMLHKALEMAFDSQQPEVLEIIASELTADSDTHLINRCADFFTTIEQHHKAVHLLAKTKHFKRSLQISIDKGVPITEQLAEMLTPGKKDLDEENRTNVLCMLGELLQQQGDYQTATKKFTQAGNKVRAMKSLLKSGNTEKIIFFANMSRQREVYIMAANYLQALNWQHDANIMKHIVTYYTKAQAYDSLGNFYAICAQIAIVEQQDYEKALKAMYDAAKCLEKFNHSKGALVNLHRAIIDVKAVLGIQNSLENGDNESVIAGCREMLLKSETPPIRQSDVLAMLIQALYYTKQYVEAGRALRELVLKEPSWRSMGLLDKALVQRIAEECNLDEQLWNLQNSGSETHDEEHNFEIQEEL